jgi:hypothetical protein
MSGQQVGSRNQYQLAGTNDLPAYVCILNPRSLPDLLLADGGAVSANNPNVKMLIKQ